MKQYTSLDDLGLSERWGADDQDIRLFKQLADEFTGKTGDAYFMLPGSFRGSELYKAFIARAVVGNKAKVILAIIMELNNIQHIKPSQSFGKMGEKDHTLELVKGIAAPTLVEDVIQYAGWKGYCLPPEFEKELDYSKKTDLIMQFTSDWLFEKLADDPDMQHYIEALAHNELLNASFGLEEGVV